MATDQRRRFSSRARATIDWSEVRSRLARAVTATEQLFTASSPQAQQLLKDRAQRLARAVTDTGTPGTSHIVLSFSMQGERFALETRYVLAVSRLLPLTRVPASPPWLAGLVYWRGQVLAALDLREDHGPGSQSDTGEQDRLVILGRDAAELALHVELPIEVEPSHAEFIAGVAEGTHLPLRSHLRGVTRQQVGWLDGTSLLKDSRFTFG